MEVILSFLNPFLAYPNYPARGPRAKDFLKSSKQHNPLDLPKIESKLNTNEITKNFYSKFEADSKSFFKAKP